MDFSLLKISALALLALSSPARAQAIDWNGYCSPSAKRVLLLVDITTPYDTQDKQILVDGLQSIVGKLGDGDRIVIRTIADSYTHTEKLIDRCMPYCPPMSFWDELFSNCTGGLILNHKRTLIAEIRASVRGRLDQFKELEHSEIVGTIAQSVNALISFFFPSSRRTPGPRLSTSTHAESLGPDFRRDDRNFYKIYHPRETEVSRG